MALARALPHVRVPAADVDEAQRIALAHQPRDAARLAFEALRGDRVAARGESSSFCTLPDMRVHGSWPDRP